LAIGEFQKPSDCKNKAELEKLLKAVTSGECKLRKMGTKNGMDGNSNMLP